MQDLSGLFKRPATTQSWARWPSRGQTAGWSRSSLALSQTGRTCVAGSTTLKPARSTAWTAPPAVSSPSRTARKPRAGSHLTRLRRLITPHTEEETP
jgi:hypothetical protein